MYAGRVVETATARALYADPRHPYTAGLMASIPTLDGDVESSRRLATIPGQPPDLAALPEGCAFAPRCPHAFERCGQPPPLEETEAGRFSACHFRPPSGGAQGASPRMEQNAVTR